MRATGDAPAGVRLQELVDKPMLVLAREMLLQQHLDAQAHGNQAVRHGIEVQLFAPGDFGVVLLYRW